MPAPRRSGAVVLVVEDDEWSRSAVRELLEGEGFEVREAASAEEALAQAAELRPDAILMDLVLPALSGLDAAGLLRNDSATAHIPLIATTGSWLGERHDLLVGAGFDGALRKPYTAGQLWGELERVLAAATPAGA